MLKLVALAILPFITLAAVAQPPTKKPVYDIVPEYGQLPVGLASDPVARRDARSELRRVLAESLPERRLPPQTGGNRNLLQRQRAEPQSNRQEPPKPVDPNRVTNSKAWEKVDQKIRRVQAEWDTARKRLEIARTRLTDARFVRERIEKNLSKDAREQRRADEQRRTTIKLRAAGLSQKKIDKALAKIDKRFAKEARAEPGLLKKVQANIDKLKKDIPTMDAEAKALRQHAEALKKWNDGGRKDKKPLRTKPFRRK